MAPPPMAENLMDAAFCNLEEGRSLAADELEALARIRREYSLPSVVKMISLVFDMGYEFLWQRTEIRAVFMGEEMVRNSTLR